MKKRAKKHNYQKKLDKLVKSGSIKDGQLHQVSFAHDGWCGIYKNKRCNCNPDVIINRGDYEN